MTLERVSGIRCAESERARLLGAEACQRLFPRIAGELA